MGASLDARRPQLSVFPIALAVFGALVLGGASGYLLKSFQAGSSAPHVAQSTGLAVVGSRPSNGIPAIDLVTGYLSGSAEDERVLTILKQSRYEGGGTVVQGGSAGERRTLDLITGYPSGGGDDQRILAILTQSRYEGGATVVQGGLAGGERP